MKILITGSNGLLGQYVIQTFLQDTTYEIIATGRGENRLRQQAGYTYEAADLTDAVAIEKLVKKHSPDIIIHSGAMTQVDDCERNKEACWSANVESVSYLLKAAAKIENAFFLQLSTDFIFDGLAGPYREEDAPNPVSYYGSSKVAAERLVTHSKLDWAIVRTVLVYGVADDPHRSNIITWVKQNLEQGKKIKVVDDQWRTPTLVQDLALGCKLIVDQRATGVFHISGNDYLTPYQMALQVADYFKLDAGLMEQVNADTFTQAGKRPAKTGFVIDKATNLLGYTPRSFGEGLRIVAEQMASAAFVSLGKEVGG